MHIQDLADVAHDDIDPSVFSIHGDEQKVSIVVYVIRCGRQLLNLHVSSTTG